MVINIMVIGTHLKHSQRNHGQTLDYVPLVTTYYDFCLNKLLITAYKVVDRFM